VFILVFKYLAEKCLQKLKQQIAGDSEAVRSSSKIGEYQGLRNTIKSARPMLPNLLVPSLLLKGIFSFQGLF
jgi:hypothetical protein